MNKLWIIALAVLVAAGAWWLSGGLPETAQVPEDAPAPGSALAEVALPASFSEPAVIGKRIFDAKCAACHNENAAGQEGVAPPLVHVIYEPSHHADEAFQRAVAMGVRGHHWPFGNMPPVEGLTRGDVQMVVAYVRELQRANGID